MHAPEQIPFPIEDHDDAPALPPAAVDEIIPLIAELLLLLVTIPPQPTEPQHVHLP